MFTKIMVPGSVYTYDVGYTKYTLTCYLTLCASTLTLFGSKYLTLTRTKARDTQIRMNESCSLGTLLCSTGPSLQRDVSAWSSTLKPTIFRPLDPCGLG